MVLWSLGRFSSHWSGCVIYTSGRRPVLLSPPASHPLVGCLSSAYMLISYSAVQKIYMLVFFFLFQSLCGPSLRRSASSRSWHREPHDYREIHLLAFHLTNTGSIRFMFFFFSGSKQNGLTRFTFGWMLWHSGGRVYICACQELLLFTLCAQYMWSHSEQ